MIRKSLSCVVLVSSVFLWAFEPPESDRDSEQTSASSTRGCVEPQGELSLIGPNPLKTHLANPILLFEVSPASPQETLLVVIKDQNFRVIFEKRISINKAGYLPLKVDRTLISSQKYQIVAGLLCQNKIRQAKVLEVALMKVKEITANDRLIKKYLEQLQPNSSSIYFDDQVQ